MPEAGSVDGNDPVTLGKLIKETADYEILGHRPIAMNQDHGSTLAAFDVVDLDPVNLDEAARWPTDLLSLRYLHGLAGLPNSPTALPDRCSGRLGRGPQDLGDLLRQEPVRSTP